MLINKRRKSAGGCLASRGVGAAPLRGRRGFRRDGGSTDRAGPVLREPPLQARAVEDVRAGQPLVAAPDRLLADDALNFLSPCCRRLALALALLGRLPPGPLDGLAPRRRVLAVSRRFFPPLPPRVAVLRLRGPRVFRRARGSADTLSIDEQGAARDAPEASLAEGVAAGQGYDGFRRL